MTIQQPGKPTSGIGDEIAELPHLKRPSVGAIAAGWSAMFVVFFALYALTASRGVQWQDSGFHIVRIITGELLHPLGLALSHPLHFWLGRASLAIPGLEPAHAITLVSSLAGALAIANVFGCVFMLTRRWQAAVLAACSLGVANTFWQLATLVECYTVTAAILSAELSCIFGFVLTRNARLLLCACLLSGLGVANHMQAVLTMPILVGVLFVAWRWRTIGLWHLLAGAVLWLLGSLPYVGLVALTAWRTGDLTGTLHSALFGSNYAGAVLNVIPSLPQLLIVSAFILLNFPNATLPLALVGAIRGRHSERLRGVWLICLAALLVHGLFVLRYDVVDQHLFLLPTYVIVALLAGLGWDAVAQQRSVKRHRVVGMVSAVLLLLTPVVYALTPPLARSFGVLDWIKHRKPYRDDYVYLFTPWTVVERSAERMSEEAVALAGEVGLIIVEDSMALPAVEYQALRDGANEITVIRTQAVSEEIFQEAVTAQRSVVLVPLDRESPVVSTPIGAWRRVGDLYVLDTLVRE